MPVIPYLKYLSVWICCSCSLKRVNIGVLLQLTILTYLANLVWILLLCLSAIAAAICFMFFQQCSRAEGSPNPNVVCIDFAIFGRYSLS